MKTVYQLSIIIILIVLSTGAAFAQSAKIINDTLYYNKTKFYKGQEVAILYGSTANKNYAFITHGSSPASEPAGTAISNRTMVVDKVYIWKHKAYIRGKVDGITTFGSALYVDVEGAIDNKEITEHNS